MNADLNTTMDLKETTLRTPKSALFFWLLTGGVLGFLIHMALPDSGVVIESQIVEEAAEQNLDLFWDVWEGVEKEYVDVDGLDEQDMIYGAISGMVDSIGDPYSVFLNPEETEQFLTGLSGELQGIGAELTVEEGKLIVVSPMKESPAELAGMLPGDHIFLVNEEPTSEMSLFDAISKIRGEEGTQVNLTILREGAEEAIELSITRASIQIPSVALKMETIAGKKIATISLYQFAEETYEEFKEEMRTLLLENPDGLILDLRRNGGGYLNVSIEILGEFFAEEVKGVIVRKQYEESEITYTQGGGKLANIPLIVLIDEGSASASEIVAGALQDHGRAKLVGVQSFGKGSVQELNELQDGSTLRLTVAKWFTPKGRGIHELGITPDILVEMELADFDTENDLQHQAAIQALLDLF